MKKSYASPTLERQDFEALDVLTTSGANGIVDELVLDESVYDWTGELDV